MPTPSVYPRTKGSEVGALSLQDPSFTNDSLQYHSEAAEIPLHMGLPLL